MSKIPGRHTVAEPLIDVIVGLSDGLVIPFALAVAVSRVSENNLVIIGWTLAAVAVGSVAMGLGSYYAAKQEYDHDTERELHVMIKLELEPEVINTISKETKQGQEQWEELAAQYGLSPSFDAARAKSSSFNIGLAYACGGLIPLTPYFFTSSVQDGFRLSVAITALCLLVFGFLKARYTSQNLVVTAARYILMGTTAAVAAYFVAGLFA
ncbi:MAG: vacuolar iron transporter 1 [Flavipsychrobacter sp.]|jgi:VIT1/CCC1 family predicted Fe2+/Mn2+ transporter|nr:vacuolar iron transporter 1 [Flavipsychrobacter sp.]